MMEHEFSRTERLLGAEALTRLAACRALVVGLGGVGASATETLARSGVGHLTLVDGDTVNVTNINRQLIALHSTLGRSKAAVMAERVRDINPRAEVEALELFYLPENGDAIDFTRFDFVLDCVDTVAAKVELIARSVEANVPVYSCMGTGNKLNPSLLKVADISETKGCPLARAVRQALKKRGITRGVAALYSEEPPAKLGERTPASVPFVPPVAGILLARAAVLAALGMNTETMGGERQWP